MTRREEKDVPRLALRQALCYVLQTHQAIQSSRDPKSHSRSRGVLSPPFCAGCRHRYPGYADGRGRPASPELPSL